MADVLWLLYFYCNRGWFLSEYLNGGMTISYGIIGIVCIALFAACLTFFIRKLFDHFPAVVIDYEGIFDNSSYISGGLIPWKDIQNIELYPLAGQKMIGIQLVDLDSYLESRQGFKRQLMKINQGMVQAPINIAQAALRMPIELIYDEMIIRWQSHIEVGSI